MKIKFFRRKNKVCKFVTIKGDVVYVCLGYKIIATLKQLTGIPSLITKMLE